MISPGILQARCLINITAHSLTLPAGLFDRKLISGDTQTLEHQVMLRRKTRQVMLHAAGVVTKLSDLWGDADGQCN